MTCVVGIVAGDGTVVLAADSHGTDWHLRGEYGRKVHEVDGAVVGFTTSYRFGQVAAHVWLPQMLEQPGVREELDERWLATRGMKLLRKALRTHGWLRRDHEVEEGGTLLLGLAGRLWVVHSDFGVAERRPAPPAPAHWAIGCGRGYALGCLHARTRELHGWSARAAADEAAFAVRAAIEFSPGCGGRVDVVRASPG